MLQVTCPECACSLRLLSWVVGGQGVAFRLVPQQETAFRQACRHPKPGPTAGTRTCPAISAALLARMPKRPKSAAVPIPQPAPVEAVPATGPAAPTPVQATVEEPGPFRLLGDQWDGNPIKDWPGAGGGGLLRLLAASVELKDRLPQVVRALAGRLDGLGDPASIVCEPHGATVGPGGGALGGAGAGIGAGAGSRRPLMIWEKRWNLRYQSGRVEGQVDPAALRSEHAASLQARRLQLLKDLQANPRIFVWRSTIATAEPDIRRLAAILRGYGPHLCLWVTPGAAGQPPGMVEYAEAGLLKAYAGPTGSRAASGVVSADVWPSLHRNVMALADHLRKRGEWAASAQAGATTGPDMFLEEVAASVVWDERKTDPMDAGPLHLGASFSTLSERADPPPAERPEFAAPAERPESLTPAERPEFAVPAERPGSIAPAERPEFTDRASCQDMRGVLIHNVVLDSVYAMLLRDGRRIAPTRYLVDDTEYGRVGVRLDGLRTILADKVAIIGFNRVYDNFYHWMAQCLPAIEVSVSRIGHQHAALVLPPLRPWQEETLSLLGLADLPRVPVDRDNEVDCYLLRTYYSDFLSGHAAYSLSRRLVEVFDHLAATVVPRRDSPARIYVGRTDTPYRRLTNEAAVQDLLARCGFVSVVPGALTIREQIQMFQGARVVVGPHGAGMTNIGFCRPGTRVLELVQASYANPCMARIAQSRGLDYHAECFDAGRCADWPMDGPADWLDGGAADGQVERPADGPADGRADRQAEQPVYGAADRPVIGRVAGPVDSSVQRQAWTVDLAGLRARLDGVLAK